MCPRPSACHICGQGPFCRCNRSIGWDRTHPEPPNFPVAPTAEGVQSRPELVRRGASDRLQFAEQNAAQLSPSPFSTSLDQPSPTDEFTNLRSRRGAFSTHSTSQQSSPFTNTPSESGSFANLTSNSSPATSNNSFTNPAYNASPLGSNNHFPNQTPSSSTVNSNSSGAQFGASQPVPSANDGTQTWASQPFPPVNDGTQTRASQPVPPADNRTRLWAPKPLRVTRNIAQTWEDTEAFTNNPEPSNSQQSRKRTFTEAPHSENEEERYHKKHRRD
ncbi:hypothetical protein EAF04_010296 [Stromatinia cepivora]|nr:hypothetical protein EAF04_010296 [Stromatinia cepivora]